MKKNRLLFICQYFYPEKISSGVLPYELASALVNKGYEVSALVGYPKEYVSNEKKCPKKEKVNNILIKRISYIQANRKSTIGRVINILSFSISALLRPIHFFRSDVCLSFTNPPLLPFIVTLYCKFFGKKHIVVVYDLYPDSPIKLNHLRENSLVAKVFNIVNRFVFNQCDEIIAISGEMKKYIIENKNIKPQKISAIHNWYQDLYKNVPYSPTFPLRIVYGGNMGIAQDMETIKKLVFKLKNDNRFEFVFAGHGSEKDNLQRFITENNIANCVMYDFLPKEEYDELLKTAALTILSIKDEVCGLGSPSKYYGYLALKKPVIAIVSRKSDIAEDIYTQNIGIQIDSESVNNARDFLIDIANDLSKLSVMSRNAYDVFTSKYSLGVCVEKYNSVIERIVK